MPSDLRILVVDDDVLVRRAVVRGLARSASVVGAATTDEALALLRAGERFDLVLLDLSMASVPSFLDEIDGVDPAQREHVYLHTGAYLSPRDVRSELVGGRVLEKPASFDAILELARALRDQPSSPADPALTRTDCASRAAAE